VNDLVSVRVESGANMLNHEKSDMWLGEDATAVDSIGRRF
jgi:hypothetical protein